jgi:hypothetical protein
MAKDVHIRDNVAIKCQSSIDEEYWILLCDTAHNIQGFNSTYELTSKVINIIQQGLEAHMLDDVDED